MTIKGNPFQNRRNLNCCFLKKDDTLSKEFAKGTPRFKGAFYQREMTKERLTKLI